MFYAFLARFIHFCHIELHLKSMSSNRLLPNSKSVNAELYKDSDN